MRHPWPRSIFAATAVSTLHAAQDLNFMACLRPKKFVGQDGCVDDAHGPLRDRGINVQDYRRIDCWCCRTPIDMATAEHLAGTRVRKCCCSVAESTAASELEYEVTGWSRRFQSVCEGLVVVSTQQLPREAVVYCLTRGPPSCAGVTAL